MDLVEKMLEKEALSSRRLSFINLSLIESTQQPWPYNYYRILTVMFIDM